MFEPSAISRGPSGLADWPRPFVFRAMHLDGQTFASGDRFHFDLNLFDHETSAIAYLVLAFAQLAREGLGPGRRRVELINVAQLNDRGNAVATLFEDGRLPPAQNVLPLEFDLAATGPEVSHLQITFLTPTELKSSQEIAARPDFGILMARIRDRISTLRELYGGGPLEIDFRAFAQRASQIQMTRCELSTVNVDRRSSRTGQIHGLGGFTGQADYTGNLTRFIPYLKCAQWTGVGRQTVWGKGAIALEVNVDA